MRMHRDTNTTENSMRQHKDDGKTKPTRYYSKRQENHVAQAINGKTVANSGAVSWAAGDVVDSQWLLECKTCTKEQKSFTMQKEWFDKNKSESIFMKKDYSAVVFNFGPGTSNIYCIDEYTFQEMKEALEEKRRNDMQNL